MLNYQTVLLILLSVVPIFFKTSKGYTYLQQRKLSDDDLIQAEVELLIVCDYEFSDRFKHDRQKIIDYWAVYMTDVNMRFKSLSSVHISFRVSSLVVINDTKDQPFIERARKNDSAISWDLVWKYFGNWAYSFQENYTDFDIALLVTGALLSDDEHNGVYAPELGDGAACKKNETSKMHLSTISMHSSATWGNTCASLEAAFAKMLGAKYDDDTFCSSEKYLMTTKACNSRQFVFSKCSNAAITKFLKSSQAACLYTAATDINVLKAATVTHPPNLDEQCVMITNRENAVVIENSKKCVLSKCSLWENGQWTYLKTLSPVDNSPCGNGKICFRGQCLPQGLMLRNVGSIKCLFSGTRYSRREFAKMVECLENPTPLDQLRILNNGHKGNLVTSPFWSPELFLYEPEMEECLSANVDIKLLQYASCKSAEEEHLGWDFIELLDGSNNSNNKEYLLSHRFTNSCAKVFPDNSIRIVKACDKDDDMMRWTFIHQPIVSLGWFNNTHVISSSRSVYSKRNPSLVNENGLEFQDNSFYIILIGILCFCLVSLCISVLIYFLRCYRRVKVKRATPKGSYESVKQET